MESEADRLKFQQHFLLVVLKMFLCPHNTRSYLSMAHPPILDVSDPRRFNWPMKIFNWLTKVIEGYQLKNNKTYKGCMFALLVSYMVYLHSI
ncbi:hypothetical protein AHAS_Ahas14G0096200 [Arachis hypogaea]